jgi:NADPH:quinone reductase
MWSPAVTVWPSGSGSLSLPVWMRWPTVRSCERRSYPRFATAAKIVVVRAWDGEPDRGITVHRINVRRRSTDAQAIRQIREEVDSMRVAATYPAEEAVAAHRRLDAGGVRGRLTLEF